MAGRGVDRDNVTAGLDQSITGLERARSHADGGSDTEASFGILACLSMLHGFDHIRSSHQADEATVRVEERQFFDTVAVEDGFGFRLGAAGGGGDQSFAWGHDIAHQNVFVLLDPDVAAGHHAEHDILSIDHGKTFDAGLAHASAELAEGGLGEDGFGMGDDDVFGAFDPADHGDLFFQRAVAVDDADAAFAGEGHGQALFGDSVHGGGDHGDSQADVTGQVGSQSGLGGKHAAASRHDGDVVEAQADGKLFIH